MNSAQQFIEGLLYEVSNKPRLLVGFTFLRQAVQKRCAELPSRQLPVDGFRARLTAHNQKGQLYRHLQFHLGLHLLGGPCILLSIAANLIDHHQAGNNRIESTIELLNNHAAYLCAKTVLSYYHQYLPYQELRQTLTHILCEPAP